MIPGGKPSLAPEVRRMNRAAGESYAPGWRVAFAWGGRSPAQPCPGKQEKPSLEKRTLLDIFLPS